MEAPRLSEYNFSVDVSGIVSAIGKIRDTRWPKPIQTDPSQRNPNLMCKYHGTHGHRTGDCRQLREKGPIFKRTKVSITREKRTQDFMPEDTLTFSKEDIEALSQPHNDALVISIILNKVQVKCVLIDPGSSTNIIISRVVEKLGLLDQIISASRVLNGFNMASETTKEEIILPVNVSETIQDTKFHVIEGDMRYNALVGRSWIHSMRAVPSTLHQMMKIPTKDGLKIVYGEQHATKEMFVVHDLAPLSTPSTSKKPKDNQVAK
ncbi:uncharacterized protein [Nicotiana sylvestris]|uniref:uncharacterized protein n=1 Tax=Nicotiana sylvestris TaxID=4096 RepID=UPI00388C8EA3